MNKWNTHVMSAFGCVPGKKILSNELKLKRMKIIGKLGIGEESHLFMVNSGWNKTCISVRSGISWRMHAFQHHAPTVSNQSCVIPRFQLFPCFCSCHRFYFFTTRPLGRRCCSFFSFSFLSSCGFLTIYCACAAILPFPHFSLYSIIYLA